MPHRQLSRTGHKPNNFNNPPTQEKKMSTDTALDMTGHPSLIKAIEASTTALEALAGVMAILPIVAPSHEKDALAMLAKLLGVTTEAEQQIAKAHALLLLEHYGFTRGGVES